MVISAAAKRCGYDERHWTTEDGHRHVSVPAPVPEKWSPRYALGELSWFSQNGVYEIRRQNYGTKYSYALLREGVELPLGGIYSRLKDAKDRAVKNAEGRDVVNVA